MTNRLPETREEYTAWSLEWNGRFRTTYQMYLTIRTEMLDVLKQWIMFTVEQYPDLVTVERSKAGTNYKVWIAGVELLQFSCLQHADLFRVLQDSPGVTHKVKSYAIQTNTTFRF